MGIKVKIKSEGAEINIKATELEYKFDDLNDNGFDKNNNFLIKVMLSGEITESTKAETLKLLEWSLEAKKDVYRSIDIEVESTNEIRRVYKLESAFIVDYVERFVLSKDLGKSIYMYRLNLIQRKEKTTNEFVKFYCE